MAIAPSVSTTAPILLFVTVPWLGTHFFFFILHYGISQIRQHFDLLKEETTLLERVLGENAESDSSYDGYVDELEMVLSKKIRLLTIRIQEYEKNIKEFNMISRMKDKKGFWN